MRNLPLFPLVSILSFFVATATSLNAWQSDNGDGTFTNPVLYADYPDPDIIRVEDTFYMVSTTFVDTPGIRILRSKDLVNWEIAGHVATTVDGGDDYDLVEGDAYRGGYWACSIRYYNGVFYVAVNPTFGNARIYYASDVGGDWDYHQLDRTAYDPGLFIDDDGTGYLVSGNDSLTLMKLSEDFSEVVEQTNGFVQTGGEGSHLVKRGDFYYLFNANPGVWPFELLCSRATQVEGPWETGRVVLTATTGGHQGSIVDLADGSWYGFVHQDSGAVGRMPNLGPVFWESDWPVFGTPENRNQIATTQTKPIAGYPLAQPSTSDDFSSTELGLQWQWNHNPVGQNWSLSERPGFLRLKPLQSDSFWTAKNTLSQKGQGPQSHGIVKLDLSNLEAGDVAGFGTLGKGNGRILVRVASNGSKTLGMEMDNRGVGTYIGAEGLPLDSDTLYLRVDLDFERELGICSYSGDGLNWQTLGGLFQLGFDISNATFQGQKYSIFCYNETTDAGGGALDVDSFTLGESANLLVMQRGRPRLNASGSTFVGDNGQLLRGHFTSTEWGGPPPQDSIAAIKELGSNAVHLYAEVFDPEYPAEGSQGPGYAVDRVDQVVEMTRELGLYLVITIGNGANNGDFNHDYVIDFWDFYAARYKDETHVIYEIQNEPVAWSPPYSQAALDMEVEAYEVIRNHAPDTPVLLFSYSVLGSSAAAMQDLAKMGSEIDWSNAGIAFHGYAGYETTAESIAEIVEEGYPVFMTEFTTSEWGYAIDHLDLELTATLERLEISWLSFLHIPPNFINQAVTEPGAFYDIVNKAGLSWVPDFGDWPVARGVYGNDGLPRSTTQERDGNVLVGTTRFELEDFDEGGQGVAYSDLDSANRGGQYRATERVDLYQTSDDGGGYAVGQASAGEWLEYTLFVQEAGYYDFALRHSNTSVSSVRAVFNGANVTGELVLEATGSIQNWDTARTQVFLEYGQQKLRLEIASGSTYLNWFELTPATEGPVDDGTYRFVNRKSGLTMWGDVDAGEILQAPYAGETSEWILEHLGAGQYRIRSAERQRYWSVFYQEDDEALDLVGWWNLDEARQRFLISPTGDGYYYFRPADGGLALDVASASLDTDAQVVQHAYSAGSHQQWALHDASSVAFPTALQVRVEGGVYELVWSESADADSYQVQRSLALDGPYVTIATGIVDTVYKDQSVEVGDIYYYRVLATSGAGESLPSAVAIANPPRLVASFGFDEASGDAVYDSSGNGWTGALAGGASWGAGREEGALEFDGLGGHALLEDGIMSELEDFTISTWAYLDTRPTWSRVFDFGSGTGSYMFLTPNSSAGAARFAITAGSGEQVINASEPLPTGRWIHLAVTLQSGIGILFLDGEEIGRNDSMTVTPSDLGETTQTFLGRSQWSADAYLDGRLDDFRIYANALDAESVMSLFESSPRPPISEDELRAPAIVVDSEVARIRMSTTVAGRTYRLEISESIDGPEWEFLGGSQSGDGGELEFEVPVERIGSGLFFRIRIQK